MMNFFDTGRGHEFADAIIWFCRHERNKEQFTAELKTVEDAEKMNNCISKGKCKLVTVYTVDGHTFAVLER